MNPRPWVLPRRYTSGGSRTAAAAHARFGRRIPLISAPPTRIIRGGTVVDIHDGSQLRGASLLVRDGRIAAIGQPAEDHAPHDAEVVDAQGAWIVPGLIDMHTHVSGRQLAIDLLPMYLANGVTTIRELGGSLTTARLLREELAQGTRIGPRFFFAGLLLDGRPPVWPPMSVLVDSPRRAESAVQFLADQEVDVIKVYNNITDDVLQTIVRVAHARSLPVTGHVPRSITMRRAVDVGMDCLEHIRITGRELLPLEEADTIDFLPLPRRESLLWDRFSLESAALHDLIGHVAERRVFMVPTLIIDWALFGGGWAAQGATDGPASVPSHIRQCVTEAPRPALYSVPAELLSMAQAGFEKRQAFVGMCARAGVRLVAGTDTFGPGVLLPGFGLLWELELLVAAGLSPLQALQAATSTASEALGQEHDLGSIDVGKRADLVLLDGDPLVDIRNVQQVRQVVRDGVVYEPAQLLAGLSAREAVASV